MATSALVCINLKTRGKGEGDDGDKDGGTGPNTQQLVQALVDNGIIQLNHKATIRVIDSAKPESQDLADFKTLNLGTFAVKQSSDTRSGILLETVGESDSGEQKVLSLVQNRPILVQRNLVVGQGKPVVHLVQAPALSSPEEPKPQPAKAIAAPQPQSAVSLSDGEPIKLPENLESLPKAEHFPTQRHRWNTNEEIAAILICFERHLDWQSKEVKIRPKSGSMLLYSRKKVRYRRDGYCWKKRKDGKTTREDHMKLKVQGTECIYGCYVHSAILPTFHRRCYWLLQNPDIVLVHYLNVPYPDDNKIVSPSLALCADKKQWTKEELISQLKPMFYSEEEPELNNELEISKRVQQTLLSQTAETVESIVCQLLERQRSARASAICKQLECGCPDSTCADAKACSQPIRRITAAKAEPDTNQVSSTTGSAGLLLGQRGITQQERGLPIHHIQQQNHHQVPHGSNTQSGPLVLSLTQPGSLLILNNQSAGQITSIVSGRHQQRKEKPMELESTVPQQVMTQMRNSPEDDKFKQRKQKMEKFTEMKEVGGGTEYYETLDLSQEDIQRTLSANMPLSCSSTDRGSREENNKQSSVLPEIEFIDVNASQHVDDVFLNLDAFDMLSEFPDLEGLDQNHNGGGLNDNGSGAEGDNMETEKGNGSPPRMDYREGTANITDYSPEWAYTEGGVKVLVTGPWYSTTSPYTVLFDSCPVPTTLVQSGVLRCFCPAHEAGVVTLQVACEGFVISNSAMFEYKRRGTQPHDSLLRFTLSQRLDNLDSRLDIKQEPQDPLEISGSRGGNSTSFEDKLVCEVGKMSRRMWRDTDMVETTVDWCDTYNGMTLLHLAASLGYSRLVCSLIHWRTQCPSSILELEVDGLNQDNDGYTPLMRACERGHSETAQLLYEWLPASGSVMNKRGEGPVEVAKKFSHTWLASELQARQEAAFIPHSSSAKGSINKDQERGESESTKGSLESLHSSRDEGVFLHPNSLVRSELGINMELHVNIPQWSEGRRAISRTSTPSPSTEGQLSKLLCGERLVKRPSVDSGIQLQSSLDSLPSSQISSGRQSKLSDSSKLSRFDRSMSLPLNPQPGDLGYESKLDNHPSPIRRMDFTLCDAKRETSPLQMDAVLLSTEEVKRQSVGEQDARVLTLAEQIIAAMPDRIKNESEGDMMMLSSEDMEVMSMESPLLLDEPPSSSSSCCFDSSEFNFDNNYRYYDVGTPCSSLSPGSCLPSPPFPLHRSPSPPPTTADFCEFLQASNSTYFEKDFSNLTLSDREQRELYEAAKVIQKAYRSYKGRKKLEQDKERQAAVLIQNYYRRYKQYAYFKQMTRAAMVIQNGYRSYCESKRFKKNQEMSSGTRVFRNYREEPESAPNGLKRTYSQRRQHQAARKIQQFMRQSKNKLQRERAEREKQGRCRGSPHQN